MTSHAPGGRRWARLVLALGLGGLLLEGTVRGAIGLGVVRFPTFGDATAPYFPPQDAVHTGASWGDRFVHHPVLGWENRPGTRDDRGATVTIQPSGIRRSRPLSGGPDAQRIVMIGDSFTFGDEVGDTETTAHRLDQLLPNTEVIDLGVPGYGQDQALLMFRERGAAYAPEVVLFGWVDADLDRNVYDHYLSRKPRFEVEGDRLRLTGVPVPDRAALEALDPWRFRAWDVVSAIWQTQRPAARDETETLARYILRDLREEVATSGAELMVAYYPDLRAPDPFTVDADDVFTAVCEELDLTCVDLRSSFEAAAARGMELRRGGHWSPEGHMVAAGVLMPRLASRGRSTSDESQ
jgi:hypothetical protein